MQKVRPHADFAYRRTTHRTRDLNRIDFVFKITALQKNNHFTIQLSPGKENLAQVKLPMTFVQKEWIRD